MGVSGEEVSASCVHPLEDMPLCASTVTCESGQTETYLGKWVPQAGQRAASLQMDEFEGEAGATRQRSREGEAVMGVVSGSSFVLRSSVAPLWPLTGTRTLLASSLISPRPGAARQLAGTLLSSVAPVLRVVADEMRVRGPRAISAYDNPPSPTTSCLIFLGCFLYLTF